LNVFHSSVIGESRRDRLRRILKKLLGERREGAVAIPVPVPVLPAGQEVIHYTVKPLLTLNAIRAISQNTAVKPV
jgi:hypothetical protein